MKENYLTVLIVCLFLFSGCKEEPKIPRELYCNADSDCVAASCCHPDSCINKNFKPDCTGIMCTMDCKPETMDCGQGKCVCQNNRCFAEISELT